MHGEGDDGIYAIRINLQLLNVFVITQYRPYVVLQIPILGGFTTVLGATS